MAFRHIHSKDYFLVLWGREVVLEDIAAVQRELDAVQATSQRAIVYIAIVPDGSQPPSPEVRRAMIKSISHPERCRAVYLVLEAQGLRAGIMRTVIAGMLLLLGGFSQNVFIRDSIGAVIKEQNERDAALLQKLERHLRSLPLPGS